MESEKILAQAEVNKILEVNAKNALEDMRIAISLSITKNSKYTGVVVSQYLDKMYAYKKFCIPHTKIQWCEMIYHILSSVEVRKPEELEEVLRAYEITGELMEELSSKSLRDVAKSFLARKLPEDMKDFVDLLMTIYSEFGLSFIDEIKKLSNEENKKGDGNMKITSETTVEEVKEQTKEVFYQMCDYDKNESKGISKAEDVMDDFMQKLENDELPKETEPKQADDFDLEVEAERIIEGYHELLEDIKELKLR